MVEILKQIAVIYSAITLFIMELLYQTLIAIIKGTRYSFTALKNALIDTMLELLSDIIMLVIDFFQSLYSGLKTGWNKAMLTYDEFRKEAF